MLGGRIVPFLGRNTVASAQERIGFRGMKKEKDIPTLDWDRALRERLPKHPEFALLEEFRMSLFFQLEIVTTSPHDDDDGFEKFIGDEIDKIADRLKEIAVKRPKAVRAALRAGRAEWVETLPCTACGTDRSKWRTEIDKFCGVCGKKFRPRFR
jgi:hypothetical protein